MATITQFEDLEVWQEARKFNLKIWELTLASQFKKGFSLVDQMQRASGSIMDNIAEGFGRGGRNEFINFLYYAKGSINEIRSQLYRAFDVNLIANDQFNDLRNQSQGLEIKLNNFISYLKRSEFKGSKFKDRKS